MPSLFQQIAVMENMVFDAGNGDPFAQEPRFAAAGKADPLFAAR